VSAGAMQVAYLSRDLGAYSNLMQECAQMQPANRRRLLHLCIVVLIMLETLRHFTESIAYSLTMLGVELLVLALIAYEVISTLWRKRVVNTRVKVYVKQWIEDASYVNPFLDRLRLHLTSPHGSIPSHRGLTRLETFLRLIPHRPMRRSSMMNTLSWEALRPPLRLRQNTCCCPVGLTICAE